MSYIRFVWYKVRKADGSDTVHRWALNVSNPSMTLEQYHAEEGFTLIAGPFKTRKEALIKESLIPVTISTIIDTTTGENDMNEIAVYGMTKEEIKEQYMESMTARFSGLEMVVMSILSDCQEMMAMGTGPRSTEYVRKQMNVAKYILGEMMDKKERV